MGKRLNLKSTVWIPEYIISYASRLVDQIKLKPRLNSATGARGD